MANLENLKRFLDEPSQNNNSEYKENNSKKDTKSVSNQSDMKAEIDKNTKMQSKPSRLFDKILTYTFLAFLILVILCIVVKGSFWGDGIKFVNIIKLFSYDLSTLLFNLMIRCFALACYLSFFKIIIDSMACRVCSNFFTETRVVWSKYRGTDIHTETTTKTTSSEFYTLVEENAVTTYTENYDELHQCKCCGKMYAETGFKVSKSRSRSSY